MFIAILSKIKIWFIDLCVMKLVEEVVAKFLREALHTNWHLSCNEASRQCYNFVAILLVEF